MGLFDIFKKQQNPIELEERYYDEVLGLMIWSEDDEAWCGEYSGMRSLINYDYAATPTPDLLSYAREILSEPAKLQDQLDQEKVAAISAFPKSADEIRRLTIESLHFYIDNKVRRIWAVLDGGDDDRYWRIEFFDDKRPVMGFDT